MNMRWMDITYPSQVVELSLKPINDKGGNLALRPTVIPKSIALKPDQPKKKPKNPYKLEGDQGRKTHQKIKIKSPIY